MFSQLLTRESVDISLSPGTEQGGWSEGRVWNSPGKQNSTQIHLRNACGLLNTCRAHGHILCLLGQSLWGGSASLFVKSFPTDSTQDHRGPVILSSHLLSLYIEVGKGFEGSLSFSYHQALVAGLTNKKAADSIHFRTTAVAEHTVLR